LKSPQLTGVDCRWPGTRDRVLGGSLERRNQLMGIILLVLLLALILGGLGFAIHILWWIALIVLVVWLVGFLVRMGEGTSRGRWYRW
jgi:hypothetical protein